MDCEVVVMKFRWWVFCKLSLIAWKICPEPKKSSLYKNLRFDPNWKNFEIVKGGDAR